MSSQEPQPRYRHAAFGVGLKHFLWGGDGFTQNQTTQIETFDISSGKWEEPRLLQGSLPDRLWSMAVTTDGEYAYSFGGYSGSTRTSNIYEINLRTMRCRELRPQSSSHAPKGTSASRIVCFDERLVVYGGYADQGYTDDLYVFDLRKSEWNSNS